MTQFGEKVWFRKIGKDRVSTLASRLTRGTFVGHHDRNRSSVGVSLRRETCDVKVGRDKH